MSLKREIFDVATKTLIQSLALNRANKLTCRFAERVSPVYSLTHEGKQYCLCCPNELTRWRAETFFTKEPETITWINTFAEDDVLFDIGANVGLYTIYAAKKGVKVFAFEPESQNYALLNKNLFLNHLGDRVTSLNLAFSDRDCIDYLFMPNFQPGGALNNLGEAVDFQHRSFQPCFQQGIMSYRVDSFLARNPWHFPAHLKVDVDGLEPRIIRGAEKTLRDVRLKSLLIEINESLPDNLETCALIETFGLKLQHRKRSALAAQGAPNTSYNYVFAR